MGRSRREIMEDTPRIEEALVEVLLDIRELLTDIKETLDEKGGEKRNV